jgi:extracelluar matrix protein FRAS1
VRDGNLNEAFSVVCYTRDLTATEDRDYVSRSSLEKSRIYFEKGESKKECLIEILDDTIYEAEENFEVRIGDLRSISLSNFNHHRASLGPITKVVVNIRNEEDGIN